MASGTVGYTDTRGNRDYSSIIANQIGKRLKEASDMASEERAYAAGRAEAGGTSLEAVSYTHLTLPTKRIV